MISITSIQQLRLHLAEEKRKNHSVGFVPTMGALHRGHISLIKQAKAENTVCVASIFVNPLQFNNPEDFNKYPIQRESDMKLMSEAGCDILFMPDVAEFYPTRPNMKIDIGLLDQILEGAHRPGHFSGVAIVVSKLFHIIEPGKAYFGQKDIQQVAVIRQLVSELNFPIEIIACPIIREESGLAMSSRNMRLSAQGKAVAANIYKALSVIEKQIKQDKVTVSDAQHAGKNYLNQFKEIEVEYLEIVAADTLEAITEYADQTKIAVCIAAYVEGVRLIDNLVIIL
ncbi:pantoate--beta-alanine ligase [Cytophaga hutchinsonii]|jgi:pantoate--beta-alanine ligase|uniref:Pantothenate synthetase n=1 Tax=Cytophaga hutchinsonii (strain ATCC 33406 / DSM 1761 / CIP 103989 / NBRC 15051 / NCIMB 9469 / D465) TaxID=269798 RepID=PANC_CYTH3|nr:pantoate--beta-alanine ligase [Cytophaga hutchinsonii]Q11NE6.1 RecName: Full=Pantothenate synthetase; Short=PS; AltName: Full=Pantoate--beta-alanine ligase; AltName: Full=Pantoate-activating enzyme [Cytophaga hutchinsonii ATCC 33406]ABG61067.1 pantothenate synthetase [Cytophaga hutchinsonii ATCC 33406]SFX45550.1 pantothenate synthetase [Cytophaga hutchinsonii ATCC 33406]